MMGAFDEPAGAERVTSPADGRVPYAPIGDVEEGLAGSHRQTAGRKGDRPVSGVGSVGTSQKPRFEPRFEDKVSIATLENVDISNSVALEAKHHTAG